MPFSNPITPTVTVLQEGLDYYTWPCIAGERWPPTFENGDTAPEIGYRTLGVWPTAYAKCKSSVSSIVWPALPTVSPRTGKPAATTISFSWAWGWTWGIGGQLEVITPWGTLLRYVWSGTAIVDRQVLGQSTPALPTTGSLVFAIGLDGTYTVSVSSSMSEPPTEVFQEGSLVATPDTSSIRAVLRSGGSVAGAAVNVHIANLKVAWA